MSFLIYAGAYILAGMIHAAVVDVHEPAKFSGTDLMIVTLIWPGIFAAVIVAAVFLLIRYLVALVIE